MSGDVKPTFPQINERVKIKTERGIFASIGGREGDVVKIDQDRYTVIVNRMPYVLSIHDFEPIVLDPTATPGELIEAMRRTVRIVTALKTIMLDRRVTDFVEGGWHAYIDEQGRVIVEGIAQVNVASRRSSASAAPLPFEDVEEKLP